MVRTQMNVSSVYALCLFLKASGLNLSMTYLVHSTCWLIDFLSNLIAIV